MIYKGKIEYGIIGDTGPDDIIGEASYAMAKSLGIDPDPSTGGTDDEVVYVAFTGKSDAVKKNERPRRGRDDRQSARRPIPDRELISGIRRASNGNGASRRVMYRAETASMAAETSKTDSVRAIASRRGHAGRPHRGRSSTRVP